MTRIARLQAHAQALILMKETGPKSAAWHRARVRTLWRLQQQITELEKATAAQHRRPDAMAHGESE
jgi:hypothetical protein